MNENLSHFEPGMVNTTESILPENEPSSAVTTISREAECLKRRELITEVPISILLLSSPSPIDFVHEENFIMNLSNEQMLALYRKVFIGPKPFSVPVENLKKNKQSFEKRCIGRSEFSNQDGKPLTIAAYCALSGEILCWENYEDMMATKQLFEKFHIFDYSKGYIMGTLHPFHNLPKAFGYHTEKNIIGYDLCQKIQYYTAM